MKSTTPPLQSGTNSTSTGIDQLEERLALATEGGERIDLMIAIGDALRGVDPARALASAETALKFARSRKDRQRTAAGLLCRGSAQLSLVNYADALVDLQKAAELFEQIDNLDGLAQALYSIGVACVHSGDAPRGIEALNRCVEIRTRLGDPAGLARANNALSGHFKRIGAYARALEYLYHGREFAEQLESRIDLGGILANIGSIHGELGDNETALRLMQEGLEIFRAEGVERKEQIALANVGQIKELMGDVEGATECYDKALEIARRIGERNDEAAILAHLGGVSRDRGRLDEAADFLRQALAIWEESGNVWSAPNVMTCLATVVGEQGDVPRAHTLMLEALEVTRSVGDRPVEVEIHSWLAEHYERTGDLARAFEHFKQHAAAREEVLGRKQQQAIDELQMREQIERAERERELFRLEKQRLESEMERKSSELTAMALNLVEKNQFLDSLKKEMSDVAQTVDQSARPVLKGLMRQVDGNISSKEDWKAFETQFEKTHQNFLKRLLASCPTMTRTELKVCALLKINLSSKEIGDLLRTSARTVEGHRSNIRKKLGLEVDVNLASYFASL